MQNSKILPILVVTQTISCHPSHTFFIRKWRNAQDFWLLFWIIVFVCTVVISGSFPSADRTKNSMSMKFSFCSITASRMDTTLWRKHSYNWTRCKKKYFLKYETVRELKLQVWISIPLYLAPIQFGEIILGLRCFSFLFAWNNTVDPLCSLNSWVDTCKPS